METFNRVLVFAHVAGGLLALVIALVPMVARKGGRWHVKAGQIYFWAMMWVMASAVVLSCTKRFVFFLLGVTVLSFYNTFTGVRCLYLKGGGAANARGRWVDWSITGATTLFGIAMIGSGLTNHTGNFTFTVLPALFGGLLLNDVFKDIRRFISPSKDPKWWWYYHLQRMMVSWVAGVTALAVNQIGTHLPGNYRVWVWVGPAVTVTPFIFIWTRYYKRKFSSNSKTTPALVPVSESAPVSP